MAFCSAFPVPSSAFKMYLIEAGTDAAAVVLFDPASLPEEFDGNEDPITLFEELGEAGRLHYQETGADGGYLLHVYVNEKLPDYLTPHLRDSKAYDSFHLDSGRLCFAGAEYSYHHDDQRLQRYPHMGGFCPLTPGVYRLNFWSCEYPGHLTRDELKSQVEPYDFRLFQTMTGLASLAVLAVLATIILFGAGVRWAWYALPVTALIVGGTIYLSRSQRYQQTRDRFREIERRYPSYVAELRS